MEYKIIKIKCLLCNSIDIYKYEIFIYDIDGNIVYNGKTNDKGYILFKVPYLGIYKIIIKAEKNICPKIISEKILIHKNCPNTILFTFKKLNKNYLSPITIKLTDKNYKNLPIEKGEIRLWQNI